jgi:hypothetical protein
MGNADSVIGVGGRGVGVGAGCNGFRTGMPLPNKRRGRLNINDTRNMINWLIKNNVRTRKLNNIPSRENKPKLSPDGRTLTTTVRIKMKKKLYIPHCLAILFEAIAMCC